MNGVRGTPCGLNLNHSEGHDDGIVMRAEQFVWILVQIEELCLANLAVQDVIFDQHPHDPRNGTAELLAHNLLAITDPQHRQARFKHRVGRARRLRRRN